MSKSDVVADPVPILNITFPHYYRKIWCCSWPSTYIEYNISRIRSDKDQNCFNWNKYHMVPAFMVYF